VNIFDYEGENDPDFDESKADRNKDGKISDWERSVGNAVAKSMREQKEMKSAENYANWMIKTDKYDGHNTDDRIWYEYSMGLTSDYVYDSNQADDNLVEDAPKILNAYKKLFAENLRLKQKVRGLEIAYDSVIDVVNEFIETDYLSDDGAEYLRYNLDLDNQFDAEEFEAPQATINPQTEMHLKWLQSQYDNVGIDRVLSVREDFEGDLFITILLTNGNKQQLIIEKSMIGMDVTEDYEKWGAEEFESEFSKGDMLNLKKYIDYPMRWIDKNIRPSSDAKVRKIEQKSKGQIPTKKTTDSFRQKIETPNWFKAVQVGILASVVGVMYFKDSGAIEEPEEPEEQKEE
tara:strand:- start:2851 stop:3888 length:1038 start_codon:yes stop_codon:yes gene_type:complete